MAIPNIEKKNIIDALAFIDENNIPPTNESSRYALVDKRGKEYPPKYVVAVADHLANKTTSISTDGFNTIEAKKYLESQGFTIETISQEKFTLVITANNAESTDARFTMNNLGLGDKYKPLDAYFQKSTGEKIKRKYNKGEKKITNQTMARIACQVFEKQLERLSVEDKEHFPVCKYNANSKMIYGIYPNENEFRKHINSKGYMTYEHDNNQFVIYCWNIFSSIIFVQECLKRFGEAGDQFVLIYTEKDNKETFNGYRNPFSIKLLESKNLIFRGAPGTGKTYLAKKIAADIVSNGNCNDYDCLSAEQKEQIEFVQFHPSYDYTDFVEGLRPKINDDGAMSFELEDGIFKKFVTRARKNYENSQKSKEDIEKELSVQESITDFFSDIELGVDTLKTIKGNEFIITSVDDKHINISIPGNNIFNKLTLKLDEIRKMLESGQKFEKIKDITSFFGKSVNSQTYSYNFAIYKAIKARKSTDLRKNTSQEEMKKYVFIIDEINRGEISKIFGELFFAIDPGYRGKEGAISTQYSNLHADPSEKFYIPDNVYIIGTMNDIDRSVDSFDFAMRRRFRFVELKADEHLDMLDALKNEELKSEAIKRMSALNKAIVAVEDLNENYQIGASYFLKLKTLSFDQLWTDYLQPLLQEYIRGMYDEEGIMRKFSEAYGYHESVLGDVNGSSQD